MSEGIQNRLAFSAQGLVGQLDSYVVSRFPSPYRASFIEPACGPLRQRDDELGPSERLPLPDPQKPYPFPTAGLGAELSALDPDEKQMNTPIGPLCEGPLPTPAPYSCSPI